MTKSSDFCNMRSEGEKANAVNMIFEMLLKGSSGELEVDECLAIHNHLKPAQVFAISTMIVDLGITNHPFLVESYNNLIVKGVPPTAMGTATFDNIGGNNTKKCAPSKASWDKKLAKWGGACYKITVAAECKPLASDYSIYLFNPYKEGDTKEGVLHITSEELLRLNPKWTTDRAPGNKTLHVGVSKDGNIVPSNKYYPYIEFS